MTSNIRQGLTDVACCVIDTQFAPSFLESHGNGIL
jgi:hypothetical protein